MSGLILKGFGDPTNPLTGAHHNNWRIHHLTTPHDQEPIITWLEFYIIIIFTRYGIKEKGTQQEASKCGTVNRLCYRLKHSK